MADVVYVLWLCIDKNERALAASADYDLAKKAAYAILEHRFGYFDELALDDGWRLRHPRSENEVDIYITPKA